jgi:hypothetical protein
LISLTRKANHTAADITYKLTWINYPVLMCGTTDENKSFESFGLMLSKHETQEEFAFMFQSVKDLAR